MVDVSCLAARLLLRQFKGRRVAQFKVNASPLQRKFHPHRLIDRSIDSRIRLLIYII